MYHNVSKARDEGVNLAFFGGNSVLCVVPMLPSSNGTPNRAARREGWFLPMPEHWLFDGTGMKKGDSIKGLLGWEWHGAPAMKLPGMNIVAEGDATINGKTVGRYSSTLYDGPKNNVVFNAATIWWANGLSSPPGHVNPSQHGVTQQGPDERVQQITHNLFQRFIG